MAPISTADLIEPEIHVKHLGADAPSFEPVLFGGDDQWIYLPESKRFDLSRGSERKLIVDADHVLHNHRGFMIDPARTVLVVIDMQNFFIHPDCRNHVGGIAAVRPTLKVMERCRHEGIQIAFLNWGIDERDLRTMPPAVQRGFCQKRAAQSGHGWHVGLGAELPNDQGRCLWKNSWNAQLYDPIFEASRPGDKFFDKNRPSGMWSPQEPLHRYLLETGKKTILFAGVNTDQCVLGTITDSYSHGFDCILVQDCAGSVMPRCLLEARMALLKYADGAYRTMTEFAAKELCNYNVSQNYGFVTDSDAFLSAVYY